MGAGVVSFSEPTNSSRDDSCFVRKPSAAKGADTPRPEGLDLCDCERVTQPVSGLQDGHSLC